MGYGDGQMAELEATINKTPCDLVLVATPIDLGKLLKIDKPSMRVRYDLKEHDEGMLRDAVMKAVGG